MMETPRLSVVIPVLNESGEIESCLSALSPLRKEGVEVIVVDGGSDDNTREKAAPLADRIVISERGRARQMNAGAAVARGHHLLFLHVDTRMPQGFDGQWLADSEWGFFNVRLSGSNPCFRLIERAMSWRSRLTAIGTGDQGLFVKRSLFELLGGFPDQPLMEDVAFCAGLKACARPRIIAEPVLTSSRRWENRGILRTVLEMWSLRAAYFVGVSPGTLVRRYYPE